MASSSSSSSIRQPWWVEQGEPAVEVAQDCSATSGIPHADVLPDFPSGSPYSSYDEDYGPGEVTVAFSEGDGLFNRLLVNGPKQMKPINRPTKNIGFDNAPLWNHVTVLTTTGGGGNRVWTCKYCGKKIIEEIGDEKVVQIVTDNAANYKAAGGKIEERFPHIFWTPCAVHCVNLAIKAICEPNEKSSHYEECKWIKDLVSQVNEINVFITNHGLSKTIFDQYSDVKLLKVAETRFASNIVMAMRLRRVKEALEKMVMDVDWKNFKVTGKSATVIQARDIKDLIVSDGWWDKVDYFLSFTEPLMKFLRVADMDSNVLPEGWLQASSNGVRRVAPNEDEEVSINRDLCFRRLFPNPDDLKKVYKEYGAFACGLDYFGQIHVMNARNEEEPLSWWANYGASTPLLQGLALKLLSQPASSSCCERNWSTYGTIQTTKRNRLTSSRLEDLVYVHMNLRLLARKKNEYREGPSSYWDIGGDVMDVDHILELVELSLNEPEIEAMTLEV
uniref:Uncharacterized protein n=1 Tax=Chenopodium quinoa TaxID=63459 RepID=A0A803N0I5_CHEQI